MKVKYLILFLILSFICITLNFVKATFSHVDIHYNPALAVSYSYQYIDERNPNYPNFENNCITFISQCLIAGGIVMDKPNSNLPVFDTKILPTYIKWFCYSFDFDKTKPLSYYLTSSFCNDTSFLYYWTKVRKVPYSTYSYNENTLKSIRDNIHVGDVIILYGKTANHSALISKIDENNIYYNSNTNNRKDFPLAIVDINDYYKITILKFTD